MKEDLRRSGTKIMQAGFELVHLSSRVTGTEAEKLDDIIKSVGDSENKTNAEFIRALELLAGMKR